MGNLRSRGPQRVWGVLPAINALSVAVEHLGGEGGRLGIVVCGTRGGRDTKASRGAWGTGGTCEY